MKVLTVFLLMAFSTHIFAKNHVQQLLDQKSDKSPFEILKEFHESNGFGVEPRELNFYNKDKNEYIENYKSCVFADSGSSAPIKADFYAYYKTKIIPGTPSNGPLFPGTPDRKVPQFYISYNIDEINRDPSENVLNETKTSITSEETYTYYGSSIMHYSTSIKKHGDLISFYNYYFYDYGDETKYTISKYGYCWND